MKKRIKLIFSLLILLIIISSCGVRSVREPAKKMPEESIEISSEAYLDSLRTALDTVEASLEVPLEMPVLDSVIVEIIVEEEKSMEVPPFLPIRACLLKGEKPREGYGAYAYLLFTSEPDSLERIRYLRVCRAFHHQLRPIEEYPEISRELLMVTFWLLSFSVYENYDSDDCNVLVDNYDYSEAQKFVAAIGKLDAKGPILVAWNHPPHIKTTNEHRLIFDLSRFAEEDYERAFRIWKDRISRNPEMWRNGFDLVKIREELRSFLQKYGDDIISIFG